MFLRFEQALLVFQVQGNDEALYCRVREAISDALIH